MKRIHHRTVLWLAIVLTVTLFIWAQSLLPAVQSQAQSDAVKGLLSGLLESSRVGRWLLEHIRTLAHFTEFAVLGVAWGLHGPLTRNKARFTLWLLLPGPLTAVADELLQLTSAGRAAQLGDLLVDGSGYVLGLALTLAAAALWHRPKSRRTGR